MNPVAEKLIGWKKDETFNRFISEVYCVRSESNEKTENTLIRALNEGRIVNNEFDVLLISKDGRKVRLTNAVLQ